MTTTTSNSKWKKIERRKARRERIDDWLTESNSAKIRAIKAFLFPRAKLRVVLRGRIRLSGQDAVNFLKGMDEPVVYNEYLTALLQEENKWIDSKWSREN